MVRIKRPVKYVHVYRDRQGRDRIYFRASGRPNIPLPGPLYSETFWIEYRRAENARPTVGEGLTRPGSFNELIVKYYQSAGFTSLARSTQSTYRNQLEDFRERHGNKLVASVQAQHIDAILGEIAKGSTAQAHKLRKRLLMLMGLAVSWDYRRDNPMKTAQRIRHKERGYRTWTEEDIDTYRKHWAKGTPERIALEVLLHTGLRRSDAVRLGRQHRRGNVHVIGIRKSQEAIDAVIPVHPTLDAHLSTVPAGCLTYIVTARGVGRSEKAFTNWIIAAAREAGLPPHSSPHGLRKATCRRLAESGCTSVQIMAITGQSLSVVERYIRDFNRSNAAAAAMASILDPIQENEIQTELANVSQRGSK